MQDKQRKPGTIYFTDHPVRINNKLIFDGYCFLGDRYYYRIRSVHNYLTHNGTQRHEDVHCYRIQPIRIKPNNYLNGKWSYTMWGKKQDISTISKGFDKKFIQNFRPLLNSVVAR
jgi:hypothetical protein